MPGNERIDSIIDLQAIQAEAAATTDLLNKIKAMITSMPQMFKDYKGATSLQELKTGTQQLTDANKQLLSMQKQLDDQKQKSLALETDIAKQLAEQRALNQQKIKDIQTEAKETAGLNNAYQQLTIQYQNALKAAQVAGAQHGVMSKQFQDAATQANMFRGQLNTIDYSLGNYQRNVGNYNGALGTLAKSIKGMGGLGIILSRAIGIDPMVFEGIRETGRALRDLQHAKELENITEKEGTEATLLNTAATQKAGVMQRLYTTIVGESTGAMKIFKLSLAATGIGALLLLIPAVVMAIKQFRQASSEAAREQEAWNEITKKGNEDSATQVATVQELYAISQDVTQSTKNRKDATEELVKINKENNDRTGEHTKLLTDQNGILVKNDTAINQLTASLIRQAMTKAAMGKIEEAFKKMLDAQTSSVTENLTWWDHFESTAKSVFTGQGMVGVAMNQTTTGVKRNSEALKDAATQFNMLKKIFADGLKGGQFSLDGIFGDGKKGAGASKQLEDFEKDVQKAIDETAKIRQQAAELALKDQVDLMKSEAENEKNSFSTRIIAYSEYLNKARELLAEQINDERTNFAASVNEDKERIKEKLKDKNLTVTQRKELNAELKALDEKLVAEELLLQQKYNSGIIKINEETESKVEALIDKQGVHAPDMSKKWDAAAKDINSKILQTTTLFIQSDQIQKKLDDEARKRRVENITFWANASKEAINSITALFETGIDRRKNAVQEVEDAQQKSYENEVTRINASSLTEQQKADKLKILEAERNAQKENNDRKQRKLDQDKARFDKVKNIVGIIEETGLAVVHQLASGDPYTAIPRAIAVGAIGAAQLAVAIAQPIPKYKQGTDSAKGGLSLTDEAGPELYVRPDGSMFLGNDRPTLRYLERGTKVIPHDDMMQMVASGAIENTAGLKVIDRKNDRKFDELKEAIIWQTKELKTNKKTNLNIHVSGDFKNSDYIRKSVYE